MEADLLSFDIKEEEGEVKEMEVEQLHAEARSEVLDSEVDRLE